MSLLVQVFIRDKSEQLTILDAESSGENLAGFENCRKTVYGGDTAKSLGLVLLPLLREQDIYVEGADLDVLQSDSGIILQNIELFAQESKLETTYIRKRVENIIDTITHAKKVGGGVVIW